MTTSTILRLAAVAIASGMLLGAMSVPASAGSITDNWPRLADDSDGSCKLKIVGNGKFMLIAASGLAPGEAAHFDLTNAAMKPIDWNIRADQAGAWSLVYLPLLWNYGDGTVRDVTSAGTIAVTVSAPQCQMTATAPWRREVRVIP